MAGPRDTRRLISLCASTTADVIAVPIDDSLPIQGAGLQSPATARDRPPPILPPAKRLGENPSDGRCTGKQPYAKQGINSGTMEPLSPE
ncbi:Hypothetical protein PSEBR_m1695 [Pseudomonas brassicacearum subsp. brassicacearum NFM421]|uniref:Uncharacterized protein n=1 Tax=Pseudomonas brassicacearum (strain NFM421) TaxID=994484 RepID=F2K6H7_PSEBN|nr:Hypothetical protein PSEBR_m1695 [Pseudomonas brassicacearum subsp. brassicacearum NFM421]